MFQSTVIATLLLLLMGTASAAPVACPPDADSAHAELMHEMGSDTYRSTLEDLGPTTEGHGLSALSNDERVAIRWYTTTEGAARINGGLKQGGHAAQKVRAASCLIQSGLRKLPDYVGPVHRGATLSDAAVKRLRAYAVMESFTFTSASWSIGFQGTDRFDIQSSTGKEITELSQWSDEREVLFPPGTRFELLQFQPEAQGRPRHWVMVEQSPGRKADLALEKALTFLGENYRVGLIQAIRYSNHPLDDATPLAEAEMVALHLFTGPMGRKLNAMLRQDGTPNPAIVPLLETIRSALTKLRSTEPSSSDSIARAAATWSAYETLPRDSLALYVPGTTISEPGVLKQTIYALERAGALPKPGPDEILCRFEIHSVHQSYVGGAYSASADDTYEAMLPAGTRFRVLARGVDLPTRCEVSLQEVELGDFAL